MSMLLLSLSLALIMLHVMGLLVLMLLLLILILLFLHPWPPPLLPLCLEVHFNRNLWLQLDDVCGLGREDIHPGYLA